MIWGNLYRKRCQLLNVELHPQCHKPSYWGWFSKPIYGNMRMVSGIGCSTLLGLLCLTFGFPRDITNKSMGFTHQQTSLGGLTYSGFEMIWNLVWLGLESSMITAHWSGMRAKESRRFCDRPRVIIWNWPGNSVPVRLRTDRTSKWAPTVNASFGVKRRLDFLLDPSGHFHRNCPVPGRKEAP